jgi:[protein-PII] uridylyltransferase
VAQAVGDRRVLDLLEVLTEADARATSPQAWTAWRAGLVRELARGVRRAFAGVAPEQPALVTDTIGERVEVSTSSAGVVVRVREPDRVGMLADIAGALLAARLPVLSARASTQDGVTGSVWLLDRDEVEPTWLRRRVVAALDEGADPVDAPVRAGEGLPAEVEVADASTDATVLEVRAQDRPGTLHAALRVLSDRGISVRSAHVGTVGPQVVDVFYVCDSEGRPLSEPATADAVAAVRRALSPAATLDA